MYFCMYVVKGYIVSFYFFLNIIKYFIFCLLWLAFFHSTLRLQDSFMMMLVVYLHCFVAFHFTPRFTNPLSHWTLGLFPFLFLKFKQGYLQPMASPTSSTAICFLYLLGYFETDRRHHVCSHANISVYIFKGICLLDGCLSHLPWAQTPIYRSVSGPFI